MASCISSTNTIILGRILEKVTNQSYASLMSVVLLIIWHILLRFIWHTDSCGRTFAFSQASRELALQRFELLRPHLEGMRLHYEL
jgi:hypothetical protein